MAPVAPPVPRRARHLIPRWLPRRQELLAAAATAVLLAHLLLAQLTLVLAVLFAVVSRTSRWRLWWLLGPALAGLAWIAATGPGDAFTGFAAGPAVILRDLRAGHLGQPIAAFAGAGRWLPGQFPVALVAGAAEAALLGWLDWLHTDEWAVPPPRPGLVAAVRRARAASAIRAGAVVTRDGCALGVVPATGAVAELRWTEVARGALVAGAAAQDVTIAGLQVVHAALRRRKPVIVLDPGDADLARALSTACAATGTPLLGPVPEPVPGRVDLGRVIAERSAALLPAGAAEPAARACASLLDLAADLRRIGVDGDALVWLPGGERAPAAAVAALLRDGPGAGLSVLIGTTSAAAAAELSGLAGTLLLCRVADPDLAVSLAARAGMRLIPDTGSAGTAATGTTAGLGAAPAAGLGAAPTANPDTVAAAAGGLVPRPVIPPRALLKLGPAEFVLAVKSPRRLVAPGRLVPARLPVRPA